MFFELFSPSCRTPFASPFGKREEAMKKKMSFAVWNSDVLSALRAFTGWSQAAKKGGKAGFVYAKDNFLSVKTLETIVTMKHQVSPSRRSVFSAFFPIGNISQIYCFITLL